MIVYQKCYGKQVYLQSITTFFKYLGNYGKKALGLYPKEAHIYANENEKYECQVLVIFDNTSTITADIRKHKGALGLLQAIDIKDIYDHISNVHYRREYNEIVTAGENSTEGISIQEH
jgi:hypothetical protein